MALAGHHEHEDEPVHATSVALGERRSPPASTEVPMALRATQGYGDHVGQAFPPAFPPAQASAARLRL